QVRARRRAALIESLNSCDGGNVTVLLHYVNYAYAKRGCPFWLVDACREWVANPEHRVITLFHELFAVGPFWRSEFWLSGTQIRLARRLHNFSSASITTTELYAKQLRTWNDGKPVAMFPVFSNAGEPQELLPLLWRKRRAIVFGRRESRQQV